MNEASCWPAVPIPASGILPICVPHLVRTESVGQPRSATVTILDDDAPAPATTPSGSAPAFTVGGRVSTPGGGDPRAVVIKPDGGIIVVGRRDVGVNAQTEFGAAGYDAAGNLDPNFGSGGIATTPIGGADDGAFDAADDRDGTLDTSLTTDFQGLGDFGHALAIDPQGRIVAAGTAGSGSGDGFALMRANL
jgi:hypothetical protein